MFLLKRCLPGPPSTFFGGGVVVDGMDASTFAIAKVGHLCATVGEEVLARPQFAKMHTLVVLDRVEGFIDT